MNVELLLLPISPEHPAGEWLRYEGTYDRIQEARREDDATLPQGIWKTAQKRANWQEVAGLCDRALREQSKDLQVAAWLLEAWLHLHGYRGLTEGLRLLHGLCERFWDELYPALDPDDPSFRTAPIEWVDRRIPLPLKLQPLTRPGGELRPLSFSDWELALHREQESQRQGAAAEEDPAAVTRSRFLTSASLTPRAELRRADEDLAAALAAIGALEALLDERLGWQSSALLQLREAAQEIRRLVAQLIGEPQPEAPAQAPAEDEIMAANEEPGDEGGGGARGPIRSRAEAYRRLEEAADFLLRTEPHSPTPYLVKRAVTWGNKPLGELLREIVGSEQDLRAIYQLLAIRGTE